MRAVFLAPSLGVEHGFYDVFAEVAGAAARYRLFVEARGWREVDFTRFSRTASPHGEPPDFTLDSILGQSRRSR